MEIARTVQVPVHYAVTKRKLSILGRLTARHTYCTWLFSKLIEGRSVDLRGYGDFTKQDMAEIKEKTKLNSAYVQQCRDQALWMWRSYRSQHRDWECQLKHAKGKWRGKLLKREPRQPFHDGLTGKVPVRIDVRTGIVVSSNRMKLSPYVLCLSTFSKNHRIIVPLNPAKYHLDLLRKGGIVDFQLVKHEGCYYAHVCVKYDVPGRAVRSVLGVDLGIRRAMATVLLKPDNPLHREDLSILTDNQKKRHLDLLTRRVAMLQEARKWEPLKQLRRKRRHVAEYFDRIDAIHVVEMAVAEQSIVAVGYPKGIKYEKYRGNGERRLRRMLQQRFPYNRRIQYIQEECAERGIRAETVVEAWTSKTCHRCGSTNTRRSTQSLFWCLDCSLQYNADWNSSMNIGSVFLPAALSRRAAEGLAQAGEDSAYKPMSPEAETIVDAATSNR